MGENMERIGNLLWINHTNVELKLELDIVGICCDFTGINHTNVELKCVFTELSVNCFPKD